MYTSAVGSLVAQILRGLVTFLGLLFVPKDQEGDLQPIFMLELSSQLIEFLWYLAVVCYYREITTWTRYIDWFSSTPVMLISTVLFICVTVPMKATMDSYTLAVSTSSSCSTG